MKKLTFAGTILGLAVLGTNAKSQESIAPSYISPVSYENYDCGQLNKEMAQAQQMKENRFTIISLMLVMIDKECDYEQIDRWLKAERERIAACEASWPIKYAYNHVMQLMNKGGFPVTGDLGRLTAAVFSGSDARALREWVRILERLVTDELGAGLNLNADLSREEFLAQLGFVPRMLPPDEDMLRMKGCDPEVIKQWRKAELEKIERMY